MCTALTSSPAKATKVPTTSAMLDRPDTGGTMSETANGICDGFESMSQANMNTIRKRAGVIVPRARPMLLMPVLDFIPRLTMNVASQNTTSTTVPM